VKNLRHQAIKYILLFVWSLTFLHAQSITLQPNQWQLLSADAPIPVTTSLNQQCIKIVWRYDTQTNQWQYSSPHVDNHSQFTAIEKINANEGFWILGKDNCTLTLPSSNRLQFTNTYDLNATWKLLGSTHSISGLDLFDKKCVNSIWAYDKVHGWGMYMPNKEGALPLRALSQLDAGNGFWVNSKENTQCSLTLSNNALASDVALVKTNTIKDIANGKISHDNKRISVNYINSSCSSCATQEDLLRASTGVDIYEMMDDGTVIFVKNILSNHYIMDHGWKPTKGLFSLCVLKAA